MWLVFFNASWMLYNIALGFIGVIFGWIMYKSKPVFMQVLFGILWILFVPNSIYMLTDSIHLYADITKVSFVYQVLLVLEYFFLMIIAVILFILSILPFELTVKKLLHKNNHIVISFVLIFMNFIIAFGMVLGRVLRLNSWDVLTNLPEVLRNSIHVLTTSDLLLLTFFFGIICNVVYFSYKYFYVQREK